MTLDQLDVSLLLPRNHVTDKNRATGRHGFVHDRPASLADVQVVGAEKFGNLVGPADKMRAHAVDHAG